VLVSAEHARGIAELLEKIAAALPEATPARAENGGAIATAVVGRPNVGKSSLVNAIIRDDRTLVSEISGTTRDAIDIPCVRDDQRYILIDTAGIRPRGKHRSSVEVFSVMRAERSIRRADLCVLVIDVTEGVTAQDKKIAGLIQKEQKPCIVAANKWDILFREAGSRKSIERVRQELFFIDYAPIILLSAKTGRNMARLFQETDAVREAATHKIGTGELNRLIRSAVDAHPPPSRGGRRFKILYVTQVEPERSATIPLPTFVFFVNDPALLTDPYRRYLESQIRSCEAFAGLPLDLKFRGRERRSTSR
jgi:GTP-binding protein